MHLRKLPSGLVIERTVWADSFESKTKKKYSFFFNPLYPIKLMYDIRLVRFKHDHFFFL